MRNKKTGVTSPMPEAQWNKVKDDPQWRGVFSVKVAPEPPEVTEIKHRKKKSAESENEANNEQSAEA